jgi:hypothetical protein
MACVHGLDPNYCSASLTAASSDGVKNLAISWFVKRFLAAFWRLCDQQIAVVTRPDDPAVGGAINQPAVHPDVRVITLRRVNNQSSHQPARRAVAWSHRWIVEMHKRHQWYPSQGVHKIIFVGPTSRVRRVCR